MDEPDATDVWGTCLTTGCESYGLPVYVKELYGALVCGTCGQTVTNITDIEPIEGTVLPQWILEMLKQQNSDNSNE